MARVLDFSAEERARVGLEGGWGARGWLGSVLGGSRSRQPSASQAPVEQSIARAFVQFLEEESEVRAPLPTLPVLEMARSKTEQLEGGRTSSNPSPLMSHSPALSLPTFSSLPPGREPAILRTVLDT